LTRAPHPRCPRPCTRTRPPHRCEGGRTAEQGASSCTWRALGTCCRRGNTCSCSCLRRALHVAVTLVARCQTCTGASARLAHAHCTPGLPMLCAATAGMMCAACRRHLLQHRVLRPATNRRHMPLPPPLPPHDASTAHGAGCTPRRGAARPRAHRRHGRGRHPCRHAARRAAPEGRTALGGQPSALCAVLRDERRCVCVAWGVCVCVGRRLGAVLH
jgi:hypothetical protein